MSFWDKHGGDLAPEPQAQQETVTPGSWWQTQQQQQPQPQVTGQQPVQGPPTGYDPARQYQNPGEYAPEDAEHLQHTDKCPRCGSLDYCEINPDMGYGGRFISGGIKQCFSCRYPAPNATGELVKAGVINDVDSVQTLSPRQGGNPKTGSWARVSDESAVANKIL